MIEKDLLKHINVQKNLIENIEEHKPYDFSKDKAREWVRTAVTLSIVSLYFISVFLVIQYGLKIIEKDQFSELKQIVDIIQALVMPIITLVLGFYFGSETKNN